MTPAERAAETQIKNLCAIMFYGANIAGNGVEVKELTNDPELWKHCDINQRETINKFVKKLRNYK